MTIPDFIRTLVKKDLLLNGPPGELYQIKMAPEGRKLNENIFNHQGKHKASAVLIPLWESNNDLSTLLIQRKIYQGVHSGQISFVGGKFEPHEQNPVEVALREAAEEVGLVPNSIEIIGNLSPLYIPASHFMVYPIVGYLNKSPDFILQDREVESTIEVPIKMILNESTIQKTIIHIQNNFQLSTPYYAINKHVVWGATAMIMSEFAELLKRNDYPAAI